MKNLITTIGSMIILFIFLMQFVTNQLTYTKILATEMEIKNFRRDVEIKGRISENDIIRVKNKVSKVAKCDAEDIIIELKQKEEQRKIEYNVRVPIEDVIGAAKMLRLSKEENRLQYTSSGVIVFPGKDAESIEEEGP